MKFTSEFVFLISALCVKLCSATLSGCLWLPSFNGALPPTLLTDGRESSEVGPFEPGPFESGPIELSLVGAADSGGNKQVDDFLGLPPSLSLARFDPGLLTGLLDIVPSEPGDREFCKFGLL